MGSVIKGYRYRLVDNRSFEIPLPLRYVLMKEDNPVAEYEIAEDEKVSVRIITKHKEDMLTPVYRKLDISDVYYFFSTRVFQDRTPFTFSELRLLGMDKYNVYEIIRKTRGVTPYDNYWIRFNGDESDYEYAKAQWTELMANAAGTGSYTMPESKPEPPKSEASVSEILSQHKLDIAAKFAENKAEEQTKKPAPKKAEEPANTMSADEIDALLMKSGLTDSVLDSFANTSEEETAPTSGGAMSQEDIEKMLAAASAPASEPETEPAPSGGKMSQEDIEKMLAAASAPAPEPEPVAESAPAPSGGAMSQEDIEKMLAGVSNPEPEPVAESAPAPSGGKMSQEDIEKMLAGVSNPEPEPAPEPVSETAPSGGKMSQEDIEKMLAAASPEPETAPEPVSEPAPSGGKMSQEDIEKMLAGVSNPEPETAPEPVSEPAPSGGKMSQEDIEKMLAGVSNPEPETAPEPVSEPAPSGGKMSQEDIEKMLAAANPEPETAPEPETEPAPSGGKMSQADIEALLNGMAKDAT